MTGETYAEARTPDEIDELARRAQDGDRDALELLLAAVRPRTLNVCRGVLPYTPDAEDACQEALINIANKIGSWGRQRPVHHLAARGGGQQRAHDVPPDEEPGDRRADVLDRSRSPTRAPPASSPAPGSTCSRRWRRIERDHPQFVEPLLLRDVYGMSYDEIAAAGRRPARHRQGADPPRPQARPAAAARRASDDARRRAAPAACAAPRWRRATPAARRPPEPSPAAAGRAPRRLRGRRRRPTVATDDPALDAARQRAGRGQRLPRRRRPRRRRPALRPRPRAGTPDGRAPHRASRHHLPRDRGRRPRSSSTSAEPLDVGDGDARRRAVAFDHDGQGPRRRGAGRPEDQRYDARASTTPARPSRSPAPTTAQRLQHHRLDGRPARRGVDDAGAVRRLHLVRRQRPAVRQGALRLHHPRARRRWSGSPTAS